MGKIILVKDHDQEIDYLSNDNEAFCERCSASIPKRRGRRFCLSCWLELQKMGVLG